MSSPAGGGSGRPLSLHPTTLAGAGPVDVVEAADAAGFPLVDVRLAPAHAADSAPSLLEDFALRRRLRAALAATGIGVLVAEVVRLRPESAARDFARHLDVAAELGARHVLAVTHDADRDRTAARLAELAELARPLGLDVLLEFMAFTEAPTAAAAAAIVAAAGHSSVGLLADALHLARSGGEPRDLVGLPIRAAQLCDAPAAGPADLAAEARTARLLPGEGELPLREFVASLPPAVPLSVEATTTAREPWLDRARRAHAAAAAVLA